MKTRCLTIVLSLLGSLSAFAAKDGKKIKVACVSSDTANQRHPYEPTYLFWRPEPGIDCGVSAVFAGFTNGKVIFAGGCNFPENSLAKDAQKKFYEGIYAFEPTDNPIVRRIGTLPEPMAYGVAVSTDDGLVLIGGTSAKQSLNTVYLLTADGEKAEVKPLPSLPHTWDNMSACALGRKVYVAGGNADGAACNRLYVLDLDNQTAGWKALKDFPGNPRVQPVLAASKDAKGNDCLYLFGGFCASGAESTLNCDGVVYNIAKNKWTTAPAPLFEDEEISVAGGSAVTLADGRICVTGGVNKDVFLNALKNQSPDYLLHPIEWYRFNPFVLIFNPAKSVWTVVSKNNNKEETTARAGSVMVAAQNGNIYVIGGELKPRVRTPHILVLKNL